jgi:Rad3-related DNA helicase
MRPTRSPEGAAADGDLERSFELDLERVSWAEPGAVSWAPVEVARTLRELLWDGEVTAVLVSATLQVAADGEACGLAFARHRLGLDDADELVVGSPFHYREQASCTFQRGFEQRARDY